MREFMFRVSDMKKYLEVAGPIPHCTTVLQQVRLLD
jgi:hypothetical protein